MPEKAEEENDKDEERVVYAKEAEVALDADGGFAERAGTSEGGERLDELPPWTTRREGGARDGGEWAVQRR